MCTLRKVPSNGLSSPATLTLQKWLIVTKCYLRKRSIGAA